MGKNQGTFQYCKSRDQIDTCVSSISGLIGAAPLKGNLLINDNVIPLDINDSENEFGKCYSCVATVEDDLLQKASKLKLTITCGEDYALVLVDSESLIEKLPSDYDRAHANVQRIKSAIMQIVSIVSQMVQKNDSNKVALSGYLATVNQNDQDLDEIMKTIGKFKSSQRRLIFEFVQEVKDVIKESYSLLSRLHSGHLDNSLIASLNSLAYRDITKKGLLKKLDQRAANNVDVINAIYPKIQDISRKLDIGALKEKYGKLADQLGDCFISCNNFIGALQNEDCFCLTFDIRRSQAAIADPSQVTIKTIYPSFMSADSFLTAAEFALSKNQDAAGGFDKKSEACIVFGAAKESITGVLPLYLCDEHWSIAKLLMKPIMGWNATLDPLGYAYSQIKIIPFMVLTKLAKIMVQNPTDFLKFQFELVKETCIRIMKDGSTDASEIKFNQEVGKLYDSYENDPSVRTVDRIAHNNVFLAQVYIAIEAGLWNKKSKTNFAEFFKKLLEEELRRKQYNIMTPEFQVNEWALKLFNIDPSVSIDPKAKKEIEKLGFGKQNYNLKFFKLYKETHNEEVKDAAADESTAGEETQGITMVVENENNSKLNETQAAAIAEYTKTLNFIMGDLGCWPGLMGYDLFAKSEIEFENIGINNNTKFTALYMQNKLHPKNADRREAIAANKYYDVWTQSEKFVEFWREKVIAEEIEKKVSLSKRGDDRAVTFAATSDLYEAAGIVIGTSFQSLSYFTKYLADTAVESKRIKEKLHMLTDGVYKGVGLYKHPVKWIPSKKTVNRIYRAFKNLCGDEKHFAFKI